MLAAAATSANSASPLEALTVGDFPETEVPDGWVRVHVKAASLNHHDLWSLRGVGLSPERLPMILGCDAAGTTDDGDEVIVHAVIGDPEAGAGDETLDPKRSLLSEVYPGTLAETVAVPSRNVIPKPSSWSFEDAACLPTAWLTAYRMLTTRGRLLEGETVLIQGAGGGVSTAAIALAHSMGARVWTTSRDDAKCALALELGADGAWPTGERLPDRVDLVIESVGEATWSHSLKSLRPGGRIVVCGSTSGPNPAADLARVFFLQLSVIGSTMGTRQELIDLVAHMDSHSLRPLISAGLSLADGREAFALLDSGNIMGKITVSVA